MVNECAIPDSDVTAGAEDLAFLRRCAAEAQTRDTQSDRDIGDGLRADLQVGCVPVAAAHRQGMP